VEASEYMTDWAIRLLVVGLAASLLWALIQQRYIFKIHIKSGRPRIAKGKVTAAFLARITDVCQEFDVRRGWIGGVAHGKRIVLHFSRSFSPTPRKRLRNEWHIL
jgi:hypothetical protein